MGRFLFLHFCQFVESGPAVIYRFNYEWQVYLSPKILLSRQLACKIHFILF